MCMVNKSLFYIGELKLMKDKINVRKTLIYVLFNFYYCTYCCVVVYFLDECTLPLPSEKAKNKYPSIDISN